MKKTAFAVLIAMTAATGLAVQESTQGDSRPALRACFETRTVFQDVSFLGRRNRGAANVTERHAEMAASGGRFVDLEVYTENNDIEGFFLTYERPAPCPETAPAKPLD